MAHPVKSGSYGVTLYNKQAQKEEYGLKRDAPTSCA